MSILAEAAEQRAARVMMLRAHGVRDRRVLNAFEHVPRGAFVSSSYIAHVPHDCPLPLPCGQTMEKPTLAARLIEALQVEPDNHVLEFGAGSGWLTAVLAVMAAKVTSFERYKTLTAAANGQLKKLGLANARVIHSEAIEAIGQELGKADRIFINAALKAAPDEMLRRLNTGAHLLTAIGDEKKPQILTRFIKTPQGFERQELGQVKLAAPEQGMPFCL